MFRLTKAGYKYFAIEIDICNECTQADINILVDDGEEVILVDDVKEFAENHDAIVKIIK